MSTDKQSSQSAKDIALMKQDIEYIKEDIRCINEKLDKALDMKANKTELKIIDQKIEKLDGRFWQIILAIVTAFIGIIALAIKVFIK